MRKTAKPKNKRKKHESINHEKCTNFLKKKYRKHFTYIKCESIRKLLILLKSNVTCMKQHAKYTFEYKTGTRDRIPFQFQYTCTNVNRIKKYPK